MNKRNQAELEHSRDTEFGSSKSLRTANSTKQKIGDGGSIEQIRKSATCTISADSVRFIPRQVCKNKIPRYAQLIMAATVLELREVNFASIYGSIINCICSTERKVS